MTWLGIMAGCLVLAFIACIVSWVESQRKWIASLRLVQSKTSELGLVWRKEDLRTALIDDNLEKVTIFSMSGKYSKVKPLSKFQRFVYGDITLYYNKEEEIAFVTFRGKDDHVSSYVFGRDTK